MRLENCTRTSKSAAAAGAGWGCFARQVVCAQGQVLKPSMRSRAQYTLLYGFLRYDAAEAAIASCVEQIGNCFDEQRLNCL